MKLPVTLFFLAFSGTISTIRAQLPGIVDVAAGEEDLSTLVTALTVGGLVDAVATVDPLTVFSPTNDAFLAMDQDLLTQILEPEWILHLQNVLLYHVAPVRALSTDLMDDMLIGTFNGENLTVSLTDGVSLEGEFFGSASVVEADLEAANGVVHKIDTVMLPLFVFTDLVDVANFAGVFNTLALYLATAGLEETLRSGTFTVLAPTDEAFAKLDATIELDSLTDILLYHVIPGVVPSVLLTDGSSPATVQGSTVEVGLSADSVTFNDATVLLADVLAINGIVHAIDTVLFPPATEFPTEVPTFAPTGAPTITLPQLLDNVVEVVLDEPDLSTLVTALSLAELVNAVADSDPITVFAPTNDAFMALDQTVLAQLLQPEWILHLQNVLLFHAAAVRVLSTDLMDGMVVMTLNGETVTVLLTKKGLMLTGDFGAALVVEADLEAANGVVHKIDTVMLPSFIFNDLVQVASGAGIFNTLISLVTLADLDDTLASGIFTVLAPTDDAFGKLDAGTVEFLTSPEGLDALTDILLYHVIPGVVPSVLLEDGITPATAQGSTVEVGVLADGSVTFNDAVVVLADVLASNGIAHAIDTVLIPPAPAPTPGKAPGANGKGKAPSKTPKASINSKGKESSKGMKSSSKGMKSSSKGMKSSSKGKGGKGMKKGKKKSSSSGKGMSGKGKGGKGM